MNYHQIQNKYNLYLGKNLKGGGINLSETIYKLFDNRLLDIYLKTLGITTLNTATLVPIALIMGKEQFNKVINNFKKTTVMPKNSLPLIDHELLGKYLKLSGLATLSLTPNTLIPIGFALSLINFITNNQQKGGSKLPIGTNFPPSYLEVINNSFNVTGSDQGIWRSSPEINNNMQFNTNVNHPFDFSLNNH